MTSLTINEGILKTSFPLHVPGAKGKLIPITVTWYRNAHHFQLNKIKEYYSTTLAQPQLKDQPSLDCPIFVLFVLYTGNNRRNDLDNFTGIHKKFYMDALKKYGIIEDDSVKFVPLTIEVFGGININNPRVDIYVSQNLNLIGILARKHLCLLK